MLFLSMAYSGMDLRIGSIGYITLWSGLDIDLAGDWRLTLKPELTVIFRHWKGRSQVFQRDASLSLISGSQKPLNGGSMSGGN